MRNERGAGEALRRRTVGSKARRAVQAGGEVEAELALRNEGAARGAVGAEENKTLSLIAVLAGRRVAAEAALPTRDAARVEEVVGGGAEGAVGGRGA